MASRSFAQRPSNSPRGQSLLASDSAQGCPDVGLVVGERLRAQLHPGGMELCDLHANRGPPRRKELWRTVEPISDPAQRAPPMLALVVGNIRGVFDQPDGVGEGGFEEGRRWGRIRHVVESFLG